MANLSKLINWKYKTSTFSYSTPAYYVGEDTIYFLRNTLLIAIDKTTGKERFNFNLQSASITGKPTAMTVFGQYLVLALQTSKTDSKLYLYDLNDDNTQKPELLKDIRGKVVWMAEDYYSSYFTLIGMSDQNMFQIQAKSSGKWDIVYNGAGSRFLPAAGYGYGMNDGMVYSSDRGNLNFFSVRRFEDTSSFYIEGESLGSPALDGDYATNIVGETPQVVFASNGKNKEVFAFNTGTKSRIWKSAPLPSTINLNIAIGKKVIYVPCENRTVYVLDKSTGRLVDSILADGPISGPIYSNPEDDILLIPSLRSILAYDPNTKNELRHAVQKESFILGTSGSNFYALTDQYIISGNVSETLQLYSVESHLMQDFEFIEGEMVQQKSGATRKPYFSTEVFLKKPGDTATKKDAQGDNIITGLGPLAHEEVTVIVNSETPVNITVNGITAQVSRYQPFKAITDLQGHLRIESKAENSIFTRAIELEVPFLEKDDRIIIHPDHLVHANLSQVDENHLANAGNYEGKSILSAKYTESVNGKTVPKIDLLKNAAQAINKTMLMSMGAQTKTQLPSRDPNSSSKRSASATPPAVGTLNAYNDSYSPDWNTRNVTNEGAYTAYKNDQLHLVPALRESWHLSLQEGDSFFQTNINKADIDARKQAKRWGLGDLIDSAEEFVEDVVNVGGKVVEVAMHAAEEAAEGIVMVGQMIVNGVTKAFEFVITSLDATVSLVQGILQDVMDGIENIMEWLSYVFDWDRIIEVQGMIAQNIKDSWTDLVDSGTLDDIKNYIDQQSASLKTLINSAFDAIKGQLNQSSASIENNQTVSGENATLAQAGARGNWMKDKFHANFFSSDPNNAGRGRRDFNISLPDFHASAAVSQAIQNIYNDIEDKVSDDVKKTIKDIMDDFSKAGDSVGDFAAAILSTLIDVFKGGIDIAIDIITAILDGVINLLKTLIKDNILFDFLESSITIPWISDFFIWATGKELTLMNLFTLMAAVPCVVIERAAGIQLFPESNNNMTRSVKASEAGGMAIAGGFLKMILAGVNGSLAVIAVAKGMVGEYYPINSPNVKAKKIVDGILEWVPDFIQNGLEKIRLAFTTVTIFLGSGSLLAAGVLSTYKKDGNYAHLIGWFGSCFFLIIYFGVLFVQSFTSLMDDKNLDAMGIVWVASLGSVGLILFGFPVSELGTHDAGSVTWDVWTYFGFLVVSFGARTLFVLSTTQTPEKKLAINLSSVGITTAFLALAGGMKIYSGIRTVV